MDKKAQWSLVAAAWVLALGVLAMGIYAIRHFSASGAVAAPGQIQTFGTAMKPICPVDHVEVVVGVDTPKVNFNGTTYYFCDTKDALGRSHKTLFLMDPLLYLTGVSTYSTPAPEATQAARPPSASPTVTATPASASQ